MKQYRMKPGQAIEVVDGPLAGRRFEPGRVYAAVPEGDMSRFEVVDGVGANNYSPVQDESPVRPAPVKKMKQAVEPTEEAKKGD